MGVFLRTFVVLIMGLVAASCATPPPLTVDADVVEPSIPTYRLGTADRVRVTVFGEDDLSGEFIVSGNGAVSLPLVGDIQAAGLTVPEFQRAVESALTPSYMLEARVSAEVLNFRPYYILGEVNEPGEYAFADGLTVLNAVATAGGFTYRANQQRVRIRRDGEVNSIDLPLSSSTPVQPGDTVQILERFF